MIQKIREELKARFLEREDLIDGALAALLCGEHVMIIGAPGTAKSMLAHETCKRFTGAKYFHWLLTKFTTPEELFGPISLKGLEDDKYYRITANKLPEAHIAFLDEVFKASSSILNTLLTLINERLFFNGDGATQVPLISLFAACNEPPHAEELRALFDRFLLRFHVGYLDDDKNFQRMLTQEEEPASEEASLKDLKTIQNEVSRIPVPHSIIESLTSLRETLNNMDVVISDRRYKQCLGPMRANAWLAGQKEVTRSNMEILKSVLWNLPDEREKVSDAIDAFIFPLEQRASKCLKQAAEVQGNLKKVYVADHEKHAVSEEAMYKLGKLGKRLDSLIASAKGSPEEPALIEIQEQFKAISTEVESACVEMSEGRG